MNAETVPTCFASPVRSDPGELASDYRRISVDHFLARLIDQVPEALVILNRNRQIVYCNEMLLQFLKLGNRAAVYGMRPGEVIGCSHSKETEGGCGLKDRIS